MFISLIVIAVWAMLFYLCYKYFFIPFLLPFAISLMVIFISGILVIIVRLLRGMEDKSHLFYILTGSFNSILGLFGLIELLTQETKESGSIIMSLLCLSMGLFILVDSFFYKSANIS